MTLRRIDGAVLRRLRGERGFTLDRFSAKSGIAERAIRSYESGRHRARAETVRCLSKALGVEPGVILLAEDGTGTRDRRDGLARKLPESSRLETLVALERQLARPTASPDEHRLTARAFQDVMTAYRVHAGRAFTIRALIDRQRGASDAEARAIGSENGVAARFLAVTEVAPGAPLAVTVFTRDAGQTVAMQAALASGAEVNARVEVCVPLGGEGFGGFAGFGVKGERPWCFVVVG